MPVPVFKSLSKLKLPGYEEDQASVLSTDSSEATVSDVGFPPSLPQLFSQGEHNDLTRHLDLSKESKQKFPGLTIEKLKAGIFDGPQIRK